MPRLENGWRRRFGPDDDDDDFAATAAALTLASAAAAAVAAAASEGRRPRWLGPAGGSPGLKLVPTTTDVTTFVTVVLAIPPIMQLTPPDFEENGLYPVFFCSYLFSLGRRFKLKITEFGQ